MGAPRLSGAARCTDATSPCASRTGRNARTQIANALPDQFELPVLFYVLTILAMITRHADLLFVVLAWMFVAMRLVHAYIHVTSNNCAPARQRVYRGRRSCWC